jgi:hypothetical protein
MSATDKNTKPAPALPPRERDTSWAIKIERAKRVREGAEKIREGKPISFPVQRTLR